jgi:hypothetical protein
MNLFFGIHNYKIKSNLIIPKFTNTLEKNANNELIEIEISENKWKFSVLKNIKQSEDFYYLDCDKINNNNFFFLASEKDLENFSSDELLVMNNFTNTTPAFRCNLEIFINNGGFSSYQSEYPFQMTKNNGNIVSSLSSLLNKDADKNYIFFRNIFYKPQIKKFRFFFINIKTRKIIYSGHFLSNSSNFLEIEKSFIKPEIFLCTENILGIPIYINEKNLHLSIEHTHPPHEYILSKNKYKKVKNLKNEISEIIKENNIIQ